MSDIVLRYNYELNKEKGGNLSTGKKLLNVQVFDWKNKVALFTGTEKEAKEKLEEFKMESL